MNINQTIMVSLSHSFLFGLHVMSDLVLKLREFMILIEGSRKEYRKVSGVGVGTFCTADKLQDTDRS